MNQNQSDRYDSIVIGSGPGGMATAAALLDAGVKRVLVLEKHDRFGGYQHTFKREKWRWNTGVHYIAHLEPGNEFFHCWRYLTANKSHFSKMPAVYEHFIYPDFEYDVPTSLEAERVRLNEMFPDEKAQIERYFSDARVVQENLFSFFMPKILPEAQAKEMLADVQKKVKDQVKDEPILDYFERYNFSEKLRRILLGKSMCSGAIPAEGSLYVQLFISAFFDQGAFHPIGTAKTMVDGLVYFIKNKGGEMRKSAGVKRILMDDDCSEAYGVELDNGEKILAENIISTVGLRQTCESFVPNHGKASHLHRVLKEYPPSLSYMALYVGFSEDPSKIKGIDGSHFWFDPHKRLYNAEDFRMNNSNIEQICAKNITTFPSLNDPEENQNHTMIVMSWVEYDYFEQWQGKNRENVGGDYKKVKEQILQGLLKPILTRFPELENLIEYSEVSTPLSVVDYVHHPRGESYGLALLPGCMDDMRLRPKTEVKGLYLSGQDITVLGIEASFFAGILSASAITGENLLPLLIEKDKKHYILPN